jgi:SET domain-containing protein
MDKALVVENILNDYQFKLKPSDIKGAGVGLFSLSKIKSGDLLYKNENLKNTNFFIPWNDIRGAHYELVRHICSTCLTNNEGFYIDNYLTDISCFYYLNHSETPNVFHDKKLDLYTALEDIEIGRELTVFYPEHERDWLNDKLEKRIKEWCKE